MTYEEALKTAKRAGGAMCASRPQDVADLQWAD